MSAVLECVQRCETCPCAAHVCSKTPWPEINAEDKIYTGIGMPILISVTLGEDCFPLFFGSTDPPGSFKIPRPGLRGHRNDKAFASHLEKVGRSEGVEVLRTS